MTPLKALVGLVALLFDAFFGKKTGAWPDGEQPLIDEPQLFDDDPFVSDSYLRYYNSSASEPLAGWFRGGFDEDSSAGSTAPEAGVDPGEGPTPGRDHTPGVGHLSSPEPLVEVDGVVPSFAVGSGRPNVTAGLLISSAIGLREYADSGACEAPTFWRSIADQIDPK